MTESERKYVDATAEIERLHKEVARLNNEVKKATYEKALAYAEIIRVRRYTEALDIEKHDLLTQMADLSIKLRKAERWLKIYKAKHDA